MYMHNNHCHRVTAHLHLIIIIIIIIITIIIIIIIILTQNNTYYVYTHIMLYRHCFSTLHWSMPLGGFR